MSKAISSMKQPKVSTSLLKIKNKDQLQNQLVTKLTKRFPDHIKEVLDSENKTVYTITKASFEKTRYGEVILISVIPASGGKTIYTYFTALITSKILEFCKEQNVKTEYGELLVGLNIVYKGEIKSAEGNWYSDIVFITAKDEEDED